MKVANEETFGPVAPLFRFKDEADVVAQANDTEFGLASYFYARDMGASGAWPRRSRPASSA
jgi:succinate-semialdehyde dehydrogenase/glutarate-semialdehyde dehydrogenase